MKVLLVDDHRLLLEGLANLLTAHGIHVAGMAHDGLEAITLVRALKPELILMDIRMPRCDGLAATRRIKAEMPAVKIVMLTTSTEDQDLFEAVKCGACGYLLKSIAAEELIEGLDQVQQGIPPFSPGLAAKILREFARRSPSGVDAPTPGREESSEAKPETGLTRRQHQVLTLVAQGLTYKEVGAKLGLSARTIKYHMAEIMEQLHLENRAQVLAYAGRMGLNGYAQEDQANRRTNRSSAS
ncbi:MAG: response regulator transcription factor [Ardenticatenaceae bacterium]|nr:response regulator transcription factor [Ardenticatenaceae bacterium]HBY98861.1 DNA-binding response regulator [Chloroflexota bacterium]